MKMQNPSGNKYVVSRYTLKKEERLCSKKMMEKLFAEGTSFLVYPFKVFYIGSDFAGNFPAKVAFAVSKKLYKKAVSRNLIKRRTREAYRLHKSLLPGTDDSKKKLIIFIYIGKEILPYRSVEKAMIRILGMIQRNFTPNP